jgi:hypothetical protein
LKHTRKDDEMKHQYNDGGRKAAGYKGTAGDCVTRSIAIAADKPYREVYDALNEMAGHERHGKRKRGISSSRNGVFRTTYQRYLESIGWKWTPTMKIGQGCTVHLRETEIPQDRALVVVLSRHLTAVINGIIHDTHNPDRNGWRCVYGYFSEAR